MPWARFEDDYLGNRKLTTLSTAAIALDMAAILFSSRELRDGFLSSSDVVLVTKLIHISRPKRVVLELIYANRWAACDGGGYAIHDYLDYQPSREQVLAERAAAAERMRRARAFGKSSPERSPEVREKFNDPVPGPGPGPERSSKNVLGTPPNPPRKRRGRVSSVSSNGLNFEEDGPKYEQRVGADGKREWVEVES
jgi:hypothetical protein